MNIKAIQTKYKGYNFRSQLLPSTGVKAMSVRADRAGRQYGRLRVVECLGMAGAGYRWWGCLCDCGTKVAVRSRELDRGHTKSCGCLQREIASQSAGANKLPEGYAARNELLASYIKSAQSRGYEWGLTLDSFVKVVTGACTYCGVARDRERRPNKDVNGGFWYTGIDRSNNAIGYIKGNVVPCCWDCNRAKGAMTLSAFSAWMDRIAARSARFEFGQSGATA